MLKKIISGGQTGADRAALDVATELGISHGGWVPKGRLAEDGPISDKYQLKEMPTDSYEARTEQNIIDSDGTLIISHGLLTGVSAYTRKMAMKHGKPWFHADLNQLPTFKAAMIIEDWISKNGIEALNVAGPRASKDPQIYGLVTVILELVHNLENAKDDRPEQYYNVPKIDRPESKDLPKTVKEAVDRLIGELSLKDKTTIANMTEDELITLQTTLGSYIGNEFGIWSGNGDLLFSCKLLSGYVHLDPDYAPPLIIKELWKRLRASHKLRIVKD
jgi:hypothetical protein